MFKLAKKLNALKYHMRKLNKDNGNVFDKVKMLRGELARVQEDLDKDPTNAQLREEEMIYATAYNEAALNEEKLLQQKTKITWLKEGDFNSAYFHKIVKGRVSKSRIDMIYDEEGHAYTGTDVPNIFVSHFQKFLGTQDCVYDVEEPRSLF